MALEGTLQDMTLTDLFQVFRSGPKTGVLVLIGGAERGVIYVNRGNLIDAVLVRGPGRDIIATGEEAVLLLLDWEEATFNFRHEVSVETRPVRIVHDSEWLVLESIRRRERPAPVLPHQHITLDSRLEMASTPGSAESGVNLDLDQWRILSQIAISQDVREICKNTGMASEQVIKIVNALVAIGLVEVAPPAKSKPRPAPRPAVEAGRVASHAPQLQPALAGGGALPLDGNGNAASGSGLLSAIMRRIRGL